eukprot:186345-Prymnesium_polylepis.1
MAGDFSQLPPVFDKVLYNNDKGNSNSDYGRQLFALFDDVVILKTVVRQDASEHELRSLVENMRDGADATAYDFDFVTSRRLHNLGQADQL